MSTSAPRGTVAAILVLLVAGLPSLAHAGTRSLVPHLRSSGPAGASVDTAAPFGATHHSVKAKAGMTTDPDGGTKPSSSASPSGAGMSTDPDGITHVAAKPSGEGMTIDPNG